MYTYCIIYIIYKLYNILIKYKHGLYLNKTISSVIIFTNFIFIAFLYFVYLGYIHSTILYFICFSTVSVGSHNKPIMYHLWFNVLVRIIKARFFLLISSFFEIFFVEISRPRSLRLLVTKPLLFLRASFGKTAIKKLQMDG